ncbi:MAG: hypothetical protein R3E79_60490 [Caldilineaceae bacterium]
MVAMVLLFPVAFFGGLPDKFLGNGQWQSAVYALWDSIFCGWPVLGGDFFRRFFNGQGHFGRFLARHSYAVYILHSPIIVLVALTVQGIAVEHLAKFAPGVGNRRVAQLSSPMVSAKCRSQRT